MFDYSCIKRGIGGLSPRIVRLAYAKSAKEFVFDIPIIYIIAFVILLIKKTGKKKGVSLLIFMIHFT